jgi:hypothetical protein
MIKIFGLSRIGRRELYGRLSVGEVESGFSTCTGESAGVSDAGLSWTHEEKA